MARFSPPVGPFRPWSLLTPRFSKGSIRCTRSQQPGWHPKARFPKTAICHPSLGDFPRKWAQRSSWPRTPASAGLRLRSGPRVRSGRDRSGDGSDRTGLQGPAPGDGGLRAPFAPAMDRAGTPARDRCRIRPRESFGTDGSPNRFIPGTAPSRRRQGADASAQTLVGLHGANDRTVGPGSGHGPGLPEPELEGTATTSAHASASLACQEAGPARKGPFGDLERPRPVGQGPSRGTVQGPWRLAVSWAAPACVGSVS